MKKTKLSNCRALLLLATALLLLTGCHDDDELYVIGHNGEVISAIDGFYYTITSSSNMTCEVTYYAYGGAVTIPETAKIDGKTYTVTSIGKWAFRGNTKLTQVTIPNSVTTIGDYSFDGCTGLTSVTIPNSVTEIGRNAFGWCEGLTEVNFNATDCTSEGYGYTNNNVSVVFPIFSSCNNLSKVTFGNNVVTIPDLLLYECESLTQVTIGMNVTTIGNGAFAGCEELTQVTIPESVTSIGDKAFTSCLGLMSVTSLNPEPPTCGSGVFVGVDTDTCTLYVPKGSKEAYSKAEVWKYFGKIVEM